MPAVFGPKNAVPDSARRLLGEGDAARDRMQWTEAANAYRLFLIEQPGNAAIWIQFGHALKESGNLPEAERAYAKAIELKPRDSDARLQIGHIYKLTSRLNEALLSYELAYFLDPTSISARDEVLQTRAHMVSALADRVAQRVRSEMPTPEVIEHEPTVHPEVVAGLEQRLHKVAAHVDQLRHQIEHTPVVHPEVVSGLEQRLGAVSSQVEHILSHVAITKALGAQLVRLTRRVDEKAAAQPQKAGVLEGARR